MNDFDPGPLADVAVQPAEAGWTLVLVRELKHPPEKVWRALTEPDQVNRWAPFEAAGPFDAPGAVPIEMVDGDSRQPMTAEVVRVEPPRLLEYDWGGDLLRWELVPTDAGTRLTLRHTHAPEREPMPSFAAGWHLCLVVAERLLDGSPIPPIRGSAAKDYGWQDLVDAYTTVLTG